MNDTRKKLFTELFKQVQKEMPEAVINNPLPKGEDPQAHFISVIASLALHIALDSEEDRRGEIK